MIHLSVIKCLNGGSSVNHPGAESSNISVDTGVVGGSAAIAPGHNTDQDTTGDQWAAGITLAGILTNGISADHGSLDLSAITIGGRSAVGAADNLDIDVSQLRGNRATGAGGTPAGDGSGSTVSGSSGGQADGLDGGASGQRRAQTDDSNIVNHGVGIVTFVVLEGSNSDQNTAGGPVGRTGTDLQDGGGNGLLAVSSSDNDLAAVDGTTARVRATTLKRDLPGERADGGGGTSNNAAIQLRQHAFGNGSSQTAGNSRQQDHELEHDELVKITNQQSNL